MFHNHLYVSQNELVLIKPSIKVMFMGLREWHNRESNFLEMFFMLNDVFFFYIKIKGSYIKEHDEANEAS